MPKAPCWQRDHAGVPGPACYSIHDNIYRGSLQTKEVEETYRGEASTPTQVAAWHKEEGHQSQARDDASCSDKVEPHYK